MISNKNRTKNNINFGKLTTLLINNNIHDGINLIPSI